MIQGSTDNISIIVIGLPRLYELLNLKVKMEEKTKEQIKVLSSIGENVINQSQKKKKKQSVDNKENYPSKLKVLDMRIQEITQNAQNLTMHHR